MLSLKKMCLMCIFTLRFLQVSFTNSVKDFLNTAFCRTYITLYIFGVRWTYINFKLGSHYTLVRTDLSTNMAADVNKVEIRKIMLKINTLFLHRQNSPKIRLFIDI